MIILDEPFVSDLLIETIVKEELPVIENSYLKEKQTNSGLNPIACEQAVIELNTKDFPLLYSNSENAIHWVFRHLKNTTLPGKIELFKNKVKFRMLVQDMFPDFYFKEIAVADLNSFDLSETAFPFIIKPSVGFFSLGVHKVDSIEHWPHIVAKINDEVLQNKKLYPTEVVNQENYIIEQLINGDEYAFDAYFDGAGNPVILGIFKHLFSSDSDVSDRVYYTSKNLIETQLEPFTNFLKEIGKRTELRNFPLHVEVRLEHNKVTPIEVNPMRFGGWCTTADLTTHAFGFNPYVYFQKQLKPNWNELLAQKEGKNYCMVILDNSTNIDAHLIESFDYERLLAKFENPLDLRKNDWKAYPIFGLLFTETKEDNYKEIEWVLKSDLKEFVNLTKQA